MTIQHKDVPDAQRHEPKGISTATVDQVYVANGSGSGTWKKVQWNGIEGTKAYGMMTITNNSVNFPITAVADTTFSTPSQFSLLTGTGAPLAGERLKGITFSVDKLTVPYTGIYEIQTYANISAFPSNTAKLSLRFLINGTTYSSRGPIVKSAVAGDADHLSAHGLISLTAGDYLQNLIASDTSGNILIRDFNTSLVLIERTA